MFKHHKKAAVALALGGVVTMAGLAYAQSQVPAAPVTPPTGQLAEAGASSTQAPWLTLRQIYDKLEAAGYSDIREIEREDNGYEAKARDAEGRVVKLHIEPLEGRIIKEKLRDREKANDRS